MQAAVDDFLSQRRIAVAGVSRQPDEAANLIYRKLKEAGYIVFPVNPRAKEVEGDLCYPHLRSIPGGVDAVVAATPPVATAELVDECLELGIQRLWMHRLFGEGSVSHFAATKGQEHGMTIIAGGCPMMFVEPVDFGHKCLRGFSKLFHRLPEVA
jgi:predicted CoA-binding protein